MIFNLFKKKEAPVQQEKQDDSNKPKLEWKETYIAGLEHYEFKKYIKALLDNDALLENDDYNLKKKDFIEDIVEGERVYQYDEYQCDFNLIRDENNEYDANAVKVVAVYRSEEFMLGYVPKNLTKQVMSSHELHAIPSLRIVGGKYKVHDGEEIEKDKTDYSLRLEYAIEKR